MITVHTNKPIALDSLDHIQPHGVMRDNSVNPDFNRKLYELIPADKVRLLDLGCAGGGLVKSILDDGGFAVGIEGSDYNLKNKRAEWATIPGNLFCADVTEPFEVWKKYDEALDIVSTQVSFNVITGWEFFEHLQANKLEACVKNIVNHAAYPGFVIGSISTHQEPHHVTVRPKAWWLHRFAEMGLVHAEDLEKHFAGCMVRTVGFPIALRVG